MSRISAWCAAIVLTTATPLFAQTSEQAAQDAFRDDVHAAVKLTCAACHQGPPGAYAPIARTAVAPLCAKCHSDPTYMRGFDPQVRVDQYAQYLTSTHGKRMSAGETRVATCIDCHGAHGIRRVRDPRSPVAPMNTAQTCAKCHADQTRMTAFNREATPFADWSASVHAAALLERGDTSAPTCSTCHGSHGATPPGVTQVANVCAQCHVREAELFRASPKKAIFDQISEPECLTCHSNHRIEHPADASVSLKDPAVCAKCHDETTKGASTILAIRRGLDSLTSAIDAGDRVLGRAERAGMLVDEGRSALREARDHQIHSRVLVHAFATKPFTDMADQGIRAASQSQRVGEQALHELQIRRRGLGAATIVILGFLVTLWFKIRRVSGANRRAPGVGTSGDSRPS
jgi:predicted CXXCH cytochrome family protein